MGDAVRIGSIGGRREPRVAVDRQCSGGGGIWRAAGREIPEEGERMEAQERGLPWVHVQPLGWKEEADESVPDAAGVERPSLPTQGIKQQTVARREPGAPLLPAPESLHTQACLIPLPCVAQEQKTRCQARSAPGRLNSPEGGIP